MARARTDARDRRREKVSGRDRAENHKSGFSSKSWKVPDGHKLFQVDKEGVRRLSIIPYEVPDGAKNPYAEDGEIHFERTYFTHRDVGPDGDMYPCLKKTFGTPCPICDHRKSMLNDPDADEDVIKKMAPKERQLWNVLDEDDPDKGIQLWDVSFHLFGKQLDARVKNSDEEDGYAFFASADDGMLLKVGFSEETFGKNSFYSVATIDFKPRKPLSDEMLDNAMILDSLLIKYTYDQLKEVFLQTKEEDSPVREPKKDEDEERPTRRPSRRGSEEDEAPKSRTKETPKEEEKSDAPSAEEPSRRRRSRSESTEDASPSEKEDPTKGMPKASEFGIEVNMLCDHPKHGKDCSVIKISRDETAVYILDAKDEKHSVTPDELSNLGWPDDAEPVKEDPKVESKSKGGKKGHNGIGESKEVSPAAEDDNWDWDDE